MSANTVQALLAATLRPAIHACEQRSDALYREARLSDAWQRRLATLCYAATQLCERLEFDEASAQYYVTQSLLAFTESRVLYQALGGTEPHVIYDAQSTLTLSSTNHAIFITGDRNNSSSGQKATNLKSETLEKFERVKRSLALARQRLQELLSQESETVERRVEFARQCEEIGDELRQATEDDHVIDEKTRDFILEEIVAVFLSLETTIERAFWILTEEKKNLRIYLTNAELLFMRCKETMMPAVEESGFEEERHLCSMYVDLVLPGGK